MTWDRTKGPTGLWLDLKCPHATLGQKAELPLDLVLDLEDLMGPYPPPLGEHRRREKKKK